MKAKLAIFAAAQPFIFMFDRFLYTFLYLNGFSFVQIAILEISYALTAVAFMFVIGNYGDIVGKKKLAAAFLVYYSLFPAAYFRFKSFASATLLRLMDGFRHQYIPLYYGIVQDLSPKQKTGRYFGVVSALSGTAALFVYLLSGFIIELSGFGALAAMTSIFLFAFAVLFYFSFPETTMRSNVSHRRASLKMVKNRFVVAYSVYQMVIIYVFITNWIYLPMKSFEVTSSFVGMGIILFAGQIILVVGQVPLGMVADRFGIFRVYVFGMLFSSATSLMLGLAGEGSMMVAANFLAGFAVSLTTPAEQAMVNKNVPDGRRAEFNNIIHLMREAGVIYSILLATAMAVWFGMDYIFYLQSAVFLIAPFVFFAAYRAAKG